METVNKDIFLYITKFLNSPLPLKRVNKSFNRMLNKVRPEWFCRWTFRIADDNTEISWGVILPCRRQLTHLLPKFIIDFCWVNPQDVQLCLQKAGEFDVSRYHFILERCELTDQKERIIGINWIQEVELEIPVQIEHIEFAVHMIRIEFGDIGRQLMYWAVNEKEEKEAEICFETFFSIISTHKIQFQS